MSPTSLRLVVLGALFMAMGSGPQGLLCYDAGKVCLGLFGMVSGRVRSYLGVVRPLERYLGNAVQNGVHFVSSA